MVVCAIIKKLVSVHACFVKGGGSLFLKEGNCSLTWHKWLLRASASLADTRLYLSAPAPNPGDYLSRAVLEAVHPCRHSPSPGATAVYRALSVFEFRGTYPTGLVSLNTRVIFYEKMSYL